MMYLPIGRLKHKTGRAFWVTDNADGIPILNWAKPRTIQGDSSQNPKKKKSELLLNVEDHIHRYKSAADWFSMFDQDDSGYLEPTELPELYRAALRRKLKKSELAEATREMDTDGSGHINEHEFEKWWRTHSGELEMYRDLAFSVSAGHEHLILVAPDAESKDKWVAGLEAAMLQHRSRQHHATAVSLREAR